ncbi:sulfite oxidase heme-binding subunit YedZ [Methylovirgula sp. 4M-Z18]|uniref:sulfite oxidase heme-binding subunit YedZ n=1 Tax=Methylovirgula sp. 4M-Z18 TaxID=2293567 RepID=UPI000E2E9AAD|nr:protein-methionine-sulfoxide reductase heme-binding subunit MsrQ [Methylovirgula sp. 4M-Z18]RFB80089.1 sulfoxide reductase heme-binding subunit YedZ [Methylovirgula sp. 4M-Z18]
MIYPWNERNGRLSWLKLIMFLVVLAPGLWIAAQWWLGWLMPKPVTEAIHQSGDWTVRFLVLSLAITPLRKLAHWGKLISVRRMIGVGAAAYASIHLSLYILDQNFALGTVASEIALRFYLTIGFTALCGLWALAATSTDGMIRRLGAKNWQRLHNIVYGVGVLAMIHFLLQSKIDVTQAVIMTGLFFGLMVWRLLARFDLAVQWWQMVLLAVGAATFTALFEAAWYIGRTGRPAVGIGLFESQFDFDIAIRPAWYVFFAWLVVAAVSFARRGEAQKKRPRAAWGAQGPGPSSRSAQEGSRAL